MFTIVLILVCFSCYSNSQSQTDFFIDPNVILVQNFEGWGSSLCWFGDVVGGMPEDVQDRITKSLFSPSELNLNILRYTIGGTVPNTTPCGPYPPGKATEVFKDALDLPYIWTRDSRQRKVLLTAKELGVNIIEAFSNTPPQWMTITGCPKGNSGDGDLHRNFEAANAPLFADYLTEVIEYYHENFNVTFDYIAPFNEPNSGYWEGATNTNSQEGCNMDRETMREVIFALNKSLEDKKINYTKITAGDETSIDSEVETQNYFTETGVSGLISKVNTHGYGGSQRDRIYEISQRNGHILWMDEMGWQNSPIEDMNQGINLANRILLDIRNMLPSAWVYWQVVEDQSSGAWGLIDVPYSNPLVSNIRYNSGFYAMMQFSKFIKQGYTIIHVNNPNAITAYDEKSETLVLVIVNSDNTDSRLEAYDLSFFTMNENTDISTFRTSRTEASVPISPPELNNFPILSYLAPSKSITTIIIKNIQKISSPNLVQNHDFETPNSEGFPAPWSLFFGTNGGSTTDYLRRGNLSGFIRTTSSDMSLNQDIELKSTKVYFLSAWVATNGKNTKIGIKINGVQGEEVEIEQWAGFKSYGIRFRGTEGDVLSFYLYAPQDGSESFIDDVQIH